MVVESASLKPDVGALRTGIVWPGVACVVALFLFPFVWPLHTRPMASFYNEWIAALVLIVACLAFAFAGKSSDRQAARVNIPQAVLLFVPLVAVILAQWALGRLTYASDALFPVWTFVLAGAATILGSGIVRRIGMERLACWISIGIIAGGLINVGIQILQLCTANGVRSSIAFLNSKGVYYGGVGQVNNLATYLSWSLVAVLYLYVARKISWLAALLLIFVFLTGATLTASRTSWIQVIWLSAVASWWCTRLPMPVRPRAWPAMFAIPVLYAAINIALPAVLGLTGFSIEETALGRVANESVVGARALLLDQGWRIFLQHPWIGIGPGQLYFNQYLLLDQVEETLFATSAHNLVLDLFLFTGVLGAVPFLLVLGTWLMRAWKMAISTERIALWLLLSVLAIHAMLELPHAYGFFLLPAAFLLGALETRHFAVKQRGLLRLLPGMAAVYGLVVCAVLLGEYRQLEDLYARYYVAQRFVPTVNEAGVAEIERFGRNTWFAGPAEFLLCYNFALNELALRQKLEISGRAVRYAPEPNIVYRHVVLLALDGRQDEGLRHLRRLRKSFPQAYDEVIAELARLGREQPQLFGRLGAASTGMPL